MTETAWRGRGSGFWGPEERARVATFNMASIAFIRAWVERSCGATTTLMMEHIDGRNKVSVRMVLDQCEIGQCDVATLDGLRKRKLKGPHLEQLLREACEGERR